VRYFFVFFSLAYGSANLYLLARFRRAFGLRWRTVLPFVPLMLPLVFAPPIVHLLERPGTLPAAEVAAWVGYTWLGMLFLFCWMHGVAELLVFGVRKLRNYPGRTLPPGETTARRTFLAVLATVVAVTAYSWHEARDIRPEHVTIESDRLPPGRDRLRIAQVSDLHVGLIIQERDVRRVVDVVREAKPDLLVSTGDLVDAGFVSTGRLPDLFAALDPPLGKYAVTGNHEYYAGIDRSLRFADRSGFRMLGNESETICEPVKRGDGPRTEATVPLPGLARSPEAAAGAPVLEIAGVDDEAALRFGGQPGDPEQRLFGATRSPRFTLFLKHRPQTKASSRGKFDLQLSGHTHRGQLFPFRWIVELQFPYVAGLYDLPGGGRLYTSRGTGTWGPRMRLMSPPEVAIIDIVRPGRSPAISK
jgi:predicted MPP superfamily phosphohydrolase